MWQALGFAGSILKRSTPIIVVAALIALGFYAVRQIPPQHAPWGAISLEDPVGLATHMKLRRLADDTATCRAALSTARDLTTRPAVLDAGTEQCPLLMRSRSNVPR